MTFENYYNEKLRERKEENRRENLSKKKMQAKSRPFFKDFIKNISVILSEGDYTSHYWCSYGLEAINIFKGDSDYLWITICRSTYMRGLGNDIIFFKEYEADSYEEIHDYTQTIYNIPFFWWNLIKTDEEAHLLIQYIKENTKEHHYKDESEENI